MEGRRPRQALLGVVGAALPAAARTHRAALRYQDGGADRDRLYLGIRHAGGSFAWLDLGGDTLNVLDFYAAADGDDLTPAFGRAQAALPAAGGTLTFPPGVSDCLAPLVATKPVVLRGAGSGITPGLRPTELRFAAGIDGIVLTDLADKSVVQHLALTSLSNGAGAGTGLRCRATRALVSDVYAEGFGDHGVFFDTATRAVTAGTESGGVATLTVAGHGFVVGETVVVAGFTPAAYNGSKVLTAVTTNTLSYAITGGTGNASVLGTVYAGNANLSRAEGVRAFDNGGDGIRVEGSDSNAITLINCDGSGNDGFGIATLAAKTGIYSPHASGNLATVTDGVTPMTVDYYDAGSSSVWINPYSEGSKAFFVDTLTGSNGYLLSVGIYAPPTVWSGSSAGTPAKNALAAANANWTVIDSGVHQRKIRLKDPAGTKEWQLLSGLLSADNFELRQQTDGKRIFTVNPTGDRLTLGDPVDLDFGATTGTKLGINATRKLGFWGNTPVVRPLATAEIKAALASIGILVDGSASPLDLDGGKATVGEAEIDGDLNHDGTGVGFYGVTPVARPGAYTQTFATADKTHANFTSADLATTAATNVTPWGFAGQAQADDIATQFNLLRADVSDLKQLVNSVIDDLQSLGLAQ